MGVMKHKQPGKTESYHISKARVKRIFRIQQGLAEKKGKKTKNLAQALAINSVVRKEAKKTLMKVFRSKYYAGGTIHGMNEKQARRMAEGYLKLFYDPYLRKHPQYSKKNIENYGRDYLNLTPSPFTILPIK